MNELAAGSLLRVASLSFAHAIRWARWLAATESTGDVAHSANQRLGFGARCTATSSANNWNGMLLVIIGVAVGLG